MDLRQLNSFVDIVEFKSFTKAAEHLHVAQPALGQQIRKLEDELQVQLLVRHSRGVEPTEAGLVLLEHAHRILGQVREAREALIGFAGAPSGRLRIGLTPSLNFMLSSRLIKACHDHLPGIALSIEEQLSAVLLEWVAAERLSFGLAHRASEHANLVYDPLFTEPLYFICRREDWGDRRTITLAEALSYSLIMPGHPHGLRKLLDESAASAGLRVEVYFEMQSVSVVRDLVAEGVGATILPYGGALRSVTGGDLVALKIVEPVVRRKIYLCHTGRQNPSPAQEAVGNLIRDVVSETVALEKGSWSPLGAG